VKSQKRRKVEAAAQVLVIESVYRSKEIASKIMEQDPTINEVKPSDMSYNMVNKGMELTYENEPFIFLQMGRDCYKYLGESCDFDEPVTVTNHSGAKFGTWNGGEFMRNPKFVTEPISRKSPKTRERDTKVSPPLNAEASDEFVSKMIKRCLTEIQFNKNIEDIFTHSRGLSWQHCYDAFGVAMKNATIDESVLDGLALNLAFYLASWGMYRGSAFLLQLDYKVHIEAIGIILEYPLLRDLSPAGYSQEAQESLSNLYKRLNDCYMRIRQYADTLQGKTKSNDKDVSDTHITKIILGTLACIPAFDRYFLNTLGSLNTAGISIPKAYSNKSATLLFSFADKYKEQLNEIQSWQIASGWPTMKVLDFVFWTYGFVMERDGT
jgi:hypothetical protein